MVSSAELGRLYRETVLDHSRNPRNLRSLSGANRRATGYNPLCGDKVTMYLQMDDEGRIADVAFEATGCAISLASASMLTEMIHGKDAAAAHAVIMNVDAMLSGAGQEGQLGEFASLSGVRAYPSRVRCATLPWRTLEAALRGTTAPVSTEK
jgi:nitrogen fixation NifU-like protein